MSFIKKQNGFKNTSTIFIHRKYSENVSKCFKECFGNIDVYDSENIIRIV